MSNDSRPNILLITTDQQRFDAAGGGAGPGFLRTPHYDDLVRNGIHFTRAYADCPVCVPSRTTIMSGLYARHHGLSFNGPTSAVLDGQKTLPGRLGRLGYQTVAIGKMHFTPQRARHGFDEMVLPDDYYRQMRESGYEHQPMRHGLGQNEMCPGMATVPEARTLTSWIAEQCVSFIRDRRDPTSPFFLWCSFSKPHAPLDPPEPYYSMYRNSPIPPPVIGDWADDANVPYSWLRARQEQNLDHPDPEIVLAARAAYYGLITQIDYNIGRIFAALQDRELMNQTLIVYTSDHGEYIGDHHRGIGKGSPLEASAHLPMVMRPPKSWGNELAGARCSHLAGLVDLLPTFVRAAGGEVPADVDGVDLTALAQDKVPPRDHLVIGGGGSDIGITDGRWKYIYLPVGPRELLFDLASDPLECRNLADQPHTKDVVERLREQLTRELAASQQRRPEPTESMKQTMQRWSITPRPIIVDGRLRADPVPDTTERQRRTGGWPGYHTDLYDADVRH